MSRAFTKETDDVVEPVVDFHVAGQPVPLTGIGRAQLADQAASAVNPHERRRLEKLLDDVVVITPPADRGIVALGATVDVSGAEISRRRFTIVGAHEADVAAGRISADSPLGAALLSRRAGDTVTWRRPIGDVSLRIERVGYGDDGAARGEAG
jgi:transcription elongation GreA/GreB family factor